MGCATTQKPVDINLVMNQAQQAYKAKDWKTSEIKFAQLISLVPNEAEFWFKLGNVYAHTNRPAKAITAYKEVVIRKPKLSKAWHNLSLMSLRQTTHLFIEMLQYLNPNDPVFITAKQSVNDLLAILKKRRTNKKILLGDYPLTVTEPEPSKSTNKQNNEQSN